MRIQLNNTNITQVLSLNTGIEPRYGKGTMKGVVRCSCGCCTGNMILFDNKTVSGFLDTECTVCGKTINYSEADKYV